MAMRTHIPHPAAAAAAGQWQQGENVVLAVAVLALSVWHPLLLSRVALPPSNHPCPTHSPPLLADNTRILSDVAAVDQERR